MEPTRPMTYGEQAVGLTFNPGNNPKVQEVKVLFAKIIDIMADVRTPNPGTLPSEKGRLASVAITEAQTAQMWAVKAITWEGIPAAPANQGQSNTTQPPTNSSN